jgi:hypothetical protein
MHASFSDIRQSERDLARTYAIAGSPSVLEPGDALAQADRVAAETLIRTTVTALANGAAVKDLDGLVQRNAGYVSHADIRAGRLGSNVLGDILGTVEQAKGTAPFNWNAATPQQISAYLASKGLLHLMHHQQLAGLGSPQSDASGTSRGGNQFGTLKEASARSGLSADNVAEFTKLGFDDKTIHMFGKVSLGANDYRALENIWGRQEVVRGAGIANDLGFRGRQAVGDVTGISDQERDLLKRYKQEKDLKKREEIEKEIMALPQRKGDTKETGEQRRKRTIKRIRADVKNEVKLRGDTKVGVGKGHEQRIADNQRLGIASEIEAEHRTTSVKLDTDSAADDMAARLARRAQTKHDSNAPASTTAQAPASSPKPETRAAQTSATTVPAGEQQQTKTAERRHAVHSAKLNPTV